MSKALVNVSPGRLFTLRLYYFAVFAAFGAYLPFFPRWLEARGVEGLSMGVVAGLLPAMGLLGPPVVGLVADALGLRGSLLRYACCGACLSLGTLAVLGGGGRVLSFSVIFAAVFFYAIFRSPLVMLADVVALERARAAGTTYGKLRLWGSVGFLVSALSIGRAVDPRAPAALPAVIASLLFVALLGAWTLPAKPDTLRLPVAREARGLVAASDFGLFLVISMFAQLAHVSYDLCFSLHLRDLGVSDRGTGLAWAIGVAFEVALMAIAEPLMKRFSAPSLLAFALLGASARWGLLAGVRSFAVLLALQPLHAISFSLWWVASLAYVKGRAPAHALATGQGLFLAAVAAGSVSGMLAWGAIYRRAGGAVVFGGAAAIALGALLVAVCWARRMRFAAKSAASPE